MKIVIEIDDTRTDVLAVLTAMDGPGLELIGVDGAHAGCRVYGLLREGCVFGPYDIVPLYRGAEA